jgi:hypothetical protein
VRFHENFHVIITPLNAAEIFTSNKKLISFKIVIL